MAYDDVVFSVHSIRRMFAARISEPEVREVLERDDVIEEFQLDWLASKRIYFAYCDRRPIHVVAIDDDEIRETTIVTVYEPDLERWEPGFRRRR